MFQCSFSFEFNALDSEYPLVVSVVVFAQCLVFSLSGFVFACLSLHRGNREVCLLQNRLNFRLPEPTLTFQNLISTHRCTFAYSLFNLISIGHQISSKIVTYIFIACRMHDYDLKFGSK